MLPPAADASDPQALGADPHGPAEPVPGIPAFGTQAAPDGGDAVLTVPNLITLVRLLSLPAFLWLLFGRHDRGGAAILLGALGATDWCDGYVARHFNQVSNLGKVFDPTVDRVLFVVGVGGIVADGSAPLWFCVIVLWREVVVAGTTVVITALGAKPVAVTWFGKAGTACLMFTFPMFLAGHDEQMVLAPVFAALAWLSGIPGVVLSYYAAARYVPQWRANLRAGRARRRA